MLLFQILAYAINGKIYNIGTNKLKTSAPTLNEDN